MRKAVYSIFVTLFLFNLQPIHSFQLYQPNKPFSGHDTSSKLSCIEPCKGCEESGHSRLCWEKRSECGRNGECFLISLINSCNDACKHCMNETHCGDVEQQCASLGVPVSCDYKPFRETCIGACSGCKANDIACIEKHNECHKNTGCSTAKLRSNCYDECTNCITEEQCAYTERHCKSLGITISCDNWRPFRGTCIGACSRSGCKRKDIACNQKEIQCECTRDKLEINCAEECAKCMTEEQCAETERQCASLGIGVSCNNWKPIFETCSLLTCARSCDLRPEDIANVLDMDHTLRERDVEDVACIEKQEECERNGECLRMRSKDKIRTICYEQCAKCVTEEQRAYTEDRCESLGITVSCPVYESCMKPCNKICGPKDSKCLQKKMECKRYGMCTHNHITSINACKTRCKYCMDEVPCIAAEQQCQPLGVTISCAISQPPSPEECIEPCFGCNHGNMTCYQKKEECRLTGVCDQVNSCATNCKHCETELGRMPCSRAEKQCKLLGIAVSCGSPPDCSVACIHCLPGDSICYQKRSECVETKCVGYRRCKDMCDQRCIFPGSSQCSRVINMVCKPELQFGSIASFIKSSNRSNPYISMECEPIFCPQACYYCKEGDIRCYKKRNQCQQFFEQNIINSIVNPSGCAWFLQYLSTDSSSPIQRPQWPRRPRPRQPRPRRPRRPQWPRQRGMAEIIDLDKDNNEVIGGVDAIHLNSGLVTIELSKLTLYVLIVVMILLLINILCLVYINYTEKRRGDKKIEYSRINVASSSDDDMENLNEVEIE